MADSEAEAEVDSVEDIKSILCNYYLLPYTKYFNELEMNLNKESRHYHIKIEFCLFFIIFSWKNNWFWKFWLHRVWSNQGTFLKSISILLLYLNLKEHVVNFFLKIIFVKYFIQMLCFKYEFCDVLHLYAVGLWTNKYVKKSL